MQNRLSPVEVLLAAKPFIPSISLESGGSVNMADMFISLFSGNASPQDRFSQQPEDSQKMIYTESAALRKHLLDALNTKAYPSEDYTIIYNALLLLAYTFPNNQLNKNNEVTCPLSLKTLNAGNCIVTAEGTWYLKSAIAEYYDQHKDSTKLLIPFTDKYFFTKQDADRIKSVADSRHSTAFGTMLEKKVSLTSNGALLGGVIGGSIVIGVALFATLLPLSLAGAIIAIGISLFAFPLMGSITGALIDYMMTTKKDIEKMASESTTEVFSLSPLVNKVKKQPSQAALLSQVTIPTAFPVDPMEPHPGKQFPGFRSPASIPSERKDAPAPSAPDASQMRNSPDQK